MATNKEIIKKLDCVEAKLMGGELEEIHQTVKEIKEDVKQLPETMGLMSKIEATGE